MKILSLDFETSWTQPVNPNISRIFEIGAILYDWDLKIPVAFQSNFIHEEDHPLMPQELQKLVGFDDAIKNSWGIPLKRGLEDLFTLMIPADYIIAHNGNEFDKPILYAEAERVGMCVPHKTWIDSKVDIDFPPDIQSRKLTYLCAEHKFINPFSHRAVFDALSVLEILKKYKIEDVIKSAGEPNCHIIASVDYSRKQLAKDRGYHWNGEEKYWWKATKLSKAQKEKEEAPFPVQIREL